MPFEKITTHKCQNLIRSYSMNGLAGIVYPDVFQMNDLIHPMIDTMKHRCRNGKDLRTFKNIQIGSCNGKLVTNERRNIIIGIDGLISNERELRQELHKEGFHLKNSKSSQILIHAYEHWGTGLFKRLDGAFALVILDIKREKILLARCRLGKQPLYWFQDQHHFIFASELKAILATGVVPQTPAMDALSAYLYFGYIPQDMSGIEGVSKLLPAHYLQYNFDGSIAITPYWSYSSYFENPEPRPKQKVVKDLDSLIKKSVLSNLPKDEEVGCFVSGELGSATVAYYLQNILPENRLSAFTVGFHGENDPDLREARAVAKQLHIPHECYSITHETFLDELVKIVWHLDDPLADPAVIAIWKMAGLASKSTTTAFSGMGTGEFFAGHSRYSLEERRGNYLHKAAHLPFQLIRKVLIPIFSVLYKPLAYQLVKQSRSYSPLFDYLEQNALFNENEMMMASTKLNRIFDPEVFLHKFHHLSRIKSRVASCIYFDVKTRLVDNYALQYDRLTAAHGLDWKAPFFNHHIAEYLASIPEPEYLEESEAAPYLKALVKGSIPQSVVERPKRTKKNFLKSWIEQPELREIFTMLLNGTLVETGLISKNWLARKITLLGTDSNAFKHLWAILILEIWFRLFIINPITTSPPNLSVKALLKETS